MRIIKLKTENVKRISVFEVTPDPAGALVTIGGKNGAGKSSVLDSIAYALGGDKLVPTQPIRSGEKEAKIVVDLGDYIVTRKFSREEIVDETKGLTPPFHVGWGPTKSALTVTNRDGAKYPSPQMLLDSLYGKLTFDPLAFSKEKPATQNEILRRLVNLDFAEIDKRRKTFYDSRAMDKKTLAIQEGKLAALPKTANAQGVYDTTETPIDEVAAEVNAGRKLHELALTKDIEWSNARAKMNVLNQEHAGHLSKIQSLEHQLAEAKQALTRCEDARHAQVAVVELASEEASKTKTAVPNFEVLDAKLRDIDLSNNRARQNKAFLAQEQEVKNYQVLIAEHTKTIDEIDEQKAAALQAAKFPVDGLGLADDGVTFDGLPLQEVSSSVQLRVSIAIGLALNPKLKILLIRNGNLLDDAGLRDVAAQAATADAQVWMEYVTSHAEGVSVMLEDGHLA